MTHEQRALLVLELNLRHNKSSEKGTKRLAAFVVADRELEISSINNYLGDRLPEFMRPALIQQLEQLPRLSNGKVDYRALEGLRAMKTLKEGVIDVKPPTETEQILTKVWEKVLDISPIELEDNFFEIGGDSILSIQIVAKARTEGIHFTAEQLFRHQTIGQLADEIEKSTKSAVPSAKTHSDHPDEESESNTRDLSMEDISEVLRQINEDRSRS